MISSIFGKTKPINYIILFAFLFLFYWVAHLFIYNRTYELENIVFQTMALAVLLFSIYVVNFIVKRNKVTDANSFAILFYSVLAIVFPETVLHSDAIFCSLCLLLATRRIISIKSLKDIKLKVFDATIWVVFSSLFYDWALLYIVLILAAIYIYEPKNFRNWLVPLAAVFAAFMLIFSVLILAGNKGFIANHYQFHFNFDKAYFMNLVNSSRLILYIMAVATLAIFAFLKLGKAGLGKIVTLRLIALSFVIGLALKVLITNADDNPIMLTFFPAVVFMTNYVESIKKPILKEFMLVASIVLPILVLVTGVLIG